MPEGLREIFDYLYFWPTQFAKGAFLKASNFHIITDLQKRRVFQRVFKNSLKVLKKIIIGAYIKKHKPALQLSKNPQAYSSFGKF